MAKHDITEFDIFFLSYDEPNAEKHWASLQDHAPWAKRVHGVKGFDAAHRACAQGSDTDWFITVDADNIVRPEFFNLTVELDESKPNQSFSWNGINMVNGLMYGNGGIKLWSKHFALTMQSHENATDPKKAVDFCWEDDYKHLHQAYSEVWPNGSPYQAFRAGFREGVKLTLNRGERIAPETMRNVLHAVNLRNVRIWSCVGADVENGLWGILGTRMGWALMCDPTWDFTLVRDYDWFQTYWKSVIDDLGIDEKEAKAAGRVTTDPVERIAQYERVVDAILDRGIAITRATRITLPLLDPDASDFFRETYKLRND